MRFTKMHGCGNDYVYIDAIADRTPPRAAWPALARRLADRHTGVGGDGLIVLARSRTADVRMVMFNADGSESEMCGNGIRCLAKLAHEHGHIGFGTVRVETGAGVRTVDLLGREQAVTGARVAMGRPHLTPSEVPVDLAAPGPRLHLPLTVAGKALRLTCVGMGNPHAVVFVADPERADVHGIGPQIERHTRFPNRTNVEFVARLADERGWPVLRQRTWERGSGETLACGTGACAATVAAILDGVITGRRAIVRLSGGDLRVTWADDHAEVVMEGPATTVFTGDIAV